MKEESFEECMERLFNSLASGKSYKSMNRLDLFRLLFNDRQKKIDELQKDEDGLSRDYHFMTVEFVKMEKELAQVKKENELLKTLVNDKDAELSQIYEWMCDSSDREASFDEWTLRYETRACEAKIKKLEEQKEEK